MSELTSRLCCNHNHTAKTVIYSTTFIQFSLLNLKMFENRKRKNLTQLLLTGSVTLIFHGKTVRTPGQKGLLYF